jgi:hypothetical protein
MGKWAGVWKLFGSRGGEWLTGRTGNCMNGVLKEEEIDGSEVEKLMD